MIAGKQAIARVTRYPMSHTRSDFHHHVHKPNHYLPLLTGAWLIISTQSIPLCIFLSRLRPGIDNSASLNSEYFLGAFYNKLYRAQVGILVFHPLELAVILSSVLTTFVADAYERLREITRKL